MNAKDLLRAMSDIDPKYVREAQPWAAPVKKLTHPVWAAAAALVLCLGLGAGALCIEGNLDFYGKSGFVAAGTKGIRCHGAPEAELAPYFLLKELRPGYLDGVTGVYHTPRGYFVDEAAAEAFDQTFPPREKLKLPGQLF